MTAQRVKTLKVFTFGKILTISNDDLVKISVSNQFKFKKFHHSIHFGLG
jgi:hypothetical protein